jgi:hypothetical protein
MTLMFEDLWDESDLEYTENRLRVHVLTLKKQGDPYPLLRLYGSLGLVLARRGNLLAAQDALNDAEFLVIEHGWRGTDKEAWFLCERAHVMQALGRDKFARRALEQARELGSGFEDPLLAAELDRTTRALAL